MTSQNSPKLQHISEQIKTFINLFHLYSPKYRGPDTKTLLRCTTVKNVKKKDFVQVCACMHAFYPNLPPMLVGGESQAAAAAAL